MAVVYLGIGSNLGDRRTNIVRALALLEEKKDIKIATVSRLIETAPQEGASLPAWQGPPQGDFLNAVARLETDLLPLELLSRLKAVERRLGRVKAEANAPRPIDLDILFYDDVVIVEGKNLCIPHPRLAERKFVLAPLTEIAPALVHPRLKKDMTALYQELLLESHPESREA